MKEAPAETTHDDRSLAAAVDAARDGDEAAFQAIYRTLQPGILRYLRTLVGEEAEDIASETWVQVVRGLDSFQGDFDDFRGWTTTIARNRAIDHLRRVRRRPVADAPVEELVITRPAVENTAESALASLGTDEALALIAQLPRDQAEALVLRIVLDLDVESTARILGKRPGAVRSAAHRGLRRLGKMVDPSRTPNLVGRAVGRRERGNDGPVRGEQGKGKAGASRAGLASSGTSPLTGSTGGPTAITPGQPTGQRNAAHTVTGGATGTLKDLR